MHPGARNRFERANLSQPPCRRTALPMLERPPTSVPHFVLELPVVAALDVGPAVSGDRLRVRAFDHEPRAVDEALAVTLELCRDRSFAGAGSGGRSPLVIWRPGLRGGVEAACWRPPPCVLPGVAYFPSLG